MTEPLSDDVRHLLERMHALTDDDLWLLADMWQREDADARRAAWTRIKSAIKASGDQDALDEVREAITAWMRTGRNDFQGIEGLLGRASGIAVGRQAAAPALIDAAAAMVAAGQIEEQDVAVLIRPWQALEESDEGDDSPTENGQAAAP